MQNCKLFGIKSGGITLILALKGTWRWIETGFQDLLFLNRKTGYTISPINVLKMAFFFGTLVQVYHKRMSLNMQTFFNVAFAKQSVNTGSIGPRQNHVKKKLPKKIITAMPSSAFLKKGQTKKHSVLRTVPPFVTAHTFCASRDIRVS